MSGIYVASKTRHADKWKKYRDEGYPICSTWIDEAGPGESADLSDLWHRCIQESANADVLVIYREPEDVLKGAWVELGAALASEVPVLSVGISEFTVYQHRRIDSFSTLDEAMVEAQRIVGVNY